MCKYNFVVTHLLRVAEVRKISGKGSNYLSTSVNSVVCVCVCVAVYIYEGFGKRFVRLLNVGLSLTNRNEKEEKKEKYISIHKMKRILI